MLNESIQIDLSDKRLYIPLHLKLIFSKRRYNISYGSRGSGKSHSIAQSIVYHLLNDEYCKALCVRKVKDTVRGSQIADIIKVIKAWKIEDLFDFTKYDDGAIVCKLNGNSVFIRGMDKPDKIKSVSDPTICWLEEADAMGENDFHIINTTLRTSEDIKIQLFITFNPVDENSWINRIFFPPKNTYEKADGSHTWIKSICDDTYILHSTYKCNPFYGEDEINALNLLPEDKKVSLLYGLWGNGKKGKIFDNIEYQDEMPPIEDRKYFAFGLDWGFSNDETAIVECCIGPEGKIYVEEHVYKVGLTNVSTTNNKNSIENELKKLEISKNWIIVADSAEPKSIKAVRDVGYNIVGVKKGKGSINNGIDILKRYTIVVCGKSPNLKREFNNYTWKMDKDDNPTNTPIDGWDHAITALRYWAMHFIGEKQHVKIRPSIRGLY